MREREREGREGGGGRERERERDRDRGERKRDKKTAQYTLTVSSSHLALSAGIAETAFSKSTLVLLSSTRSEEYHQKLRLIKPHPSANKPHPSTYRLNVTDDQCMPLSNLVGRCNA